MAFALLVIATVASAQMPEEGAFRFGPYRATIEGLAGPSALVIDADGAIYVAEAGEGRVSVFDSSGVALRVVGAPGSGPGELLRPGGLALLPDGALLVADGGNHRIQVFDADGRFVRAWGRYGTGEGEFNDPHGVAVDGRRIYVADLGNDRVQVFDHAGRFLHALTSEGSGAGRLRRPSDVAIDEAGFLYVADAGHDRVQKFDGEGAFVRAWGDYGPFQGLMDRPRGIAWRDGEVYVADTRNHRVQIFAGDGDLLLQWGTHAIRLHEGDGRLHYPNALAIAPSGAFGVIAESFENRCQIFDAGDPTQDKPARAVAIKAKQAHFGSSIDVDGNLLGIAEPETHRVHLFDIRNAVPIVIGSFGERGDRFGQMIRAAGVAVSVDPPRLFLSDIAVGRVQVFNVDYDPAETPRYSLRRARFSRAFDLAAIAAGTPDLDLAWPIEPVEIERDADGGFYLVDARNSMILVFDHDMTFRRAWGGYGGETGRFRRPTDLALGADGETVFVVDADNHRVQVFDRSGRFVRTWGERGLGDGLFKQPFGVATGKDGSVYVTDAAAHRVQKFTSKGSLVTAWGALGTDHGQLWSPRGIVEDDRGRLLVVDQGNHRAQIFSADGEWLVTFSTGRAFTPEMLRRGKGP